MSEQNKSNFQALGAGFLGFAVVMVVGGGALMLHNSHQAKLAAHPVAAAAPIDIGSSSPRPMQGLGAPKEQREGSPAPLMGDQGSAEASPASAPGSVAPARGAQNAAATAAAPAAQAAQTAQAESSGAGLQVDEHLSSSGNGSSAEASVKNTLHAKQAHKAKKGATTATAGAAKPDAAGSDAIASVHYGVTNRNELMGRAAGPVYNFQGAGKGGDTVGKGQMADPKAQIADIKKQLEGANLPPEQRAALLKQLDAAGEAAPK